MGEIGLGGTGLGGTELGCTKLAGAGAAGFELGGTESDGMGLGWARLGSAELAGAGLGGTGADETGSGGAGLGDGGGKAAARRWRTAVVSGRDRRLGGVRDEAVEPVWWKGSAGFRACGRWLWSARRRLGRVRWWNWALLRW
ncbi:hypothetical protein [Lentzea jiangxiensis]|uniref:hypothetical protein n=1 Tax=Lentzea jiangxiensis TaxID=641025 RepID=UPI000B2F931D|nr:hypothetical protein [Lentzea jiangxiensis]